MHKFYREFKQQKRNNKIEDIASFRKESSQLLEAYKTFKINPESEK